MSEQEKSLAKAEFRRLQDEFSRLRLELATIDSHWWKVGSQRRIERAEIKIKMSQNSIARRHFARLLERLHEKERRDCNLAKAGRAWSDQMLACLTHLLEESGQHSLLKRARVLVAAGWPHSHRKP